MGTTQNANIYKVKEALVKDVGRAIVRMDPKDMKSQGFETGDIVMIEGKRKTPAKVIPCYEEYRGKQILQLDGITRENAKVGLEDKIKIEKASWEPAKKIWLRPEGSSNSPYKDNDTSYLSTLIDGLPITNGDKIRATFFGTGIVDYMVTDTNPSGIVLVHSGTQVQLSRLKQNGKRSAKVLYEDIGGLTTQLQRIREMIELPLKYPVLFDKMGIEPPKGVILHGPPGTGKTLIVRAVANETDAHFIHLSGPEIMGKFYGESEERLRKVFAEAQSHAPAIIFIDEIDAIAPKREDVGSEKQVEKRVVAQLLSLMDGLESRGKIIVIGATNIPNTIDPALRRPGRFDREIAIPVPDKNGRLEILEIYTRGMPLAMDVKLSKLAEITHGFVGADLEALAREAAMTTLRKIIPAINFEQAQVPSEILTNLEVAMDDFYNAMKDVEPSAIREVFVEVSDVKWADVGGLDGIKEALKEAVQWPLMYSELFRAMNTIATKGIILYGRPGTGKTYLAKAIANECGVNFIAIKGPQLMNKYVGESEKAVREIFRIARQAAPTILFFDEIDSLVSRRGNDSSTVVDRVISQFLTEMDGIEDMKGIVVLAATNRIDLIDPALLRSGRFDLIFELPVPDELTRERIFEIHTEKKPLHKDVNLRRLAQKTENMVGADIEFICRKASILSIREIIADNKGGSAVSETNPVAIKQKHFMQAIYIVNEQNLLKK